MESTEVLVVRRMEFGSALLASVIGLTWVALLVQLMRLLTEASNLLGMGSLLLTPPMGWTMLWLYSAAMVIADVGTSDSYNNADELNGAPFDANGNQLTSSDGLSFISNAADQTTGIIPTGGSIVSQSYLGDGQTRRTASGGNSYQYDQTGMSVATVSGTTAYLTKTPDGELLSERIPSGTSAGNYYPSTVSVRWWRLSTALARWWLAPRGPYGDVSQRGSTPLGAITDVAN